MHVRRGLSSHGLLTRPQRHTLECWEVVAVDPFVIGIALIALFLVWAGWKVRGRDNRMGPELKGERDRRTERLL